MIYDDWTTIDKSLLAPYYLKLARDSYDNCLAYLDEMLGQLHDDLARRGLARKDLDRHRRRSWRRTGGTRSL